MAAQISNNRGMARFLDEEWQTHLYRSTGESQHSDGGIVSRYSPARYADFDRRRAVHATSSWDSRSCHKIKLFRLTSVAAFFVRRIGMENVISNRLKLVIGDITKL